MFIGLPSFYGGWLQMVYGMPQHAGLAEDVLDHRLNTRTVYLNPINRFLYWNMGYHIEHHMFPMVPYHNLGKLHALMKDDCPPPYHGLVEAYRETHPGADPPVEGPGLLIKRALPPPSAAADTMRAREVITSDAAAGRRGLGRGVRAGPCSCRATAALRARRRSYAVYRTDIGQLFASDDQCTHGNGSTSPTASCRAPDRVPQAQRPLRRPRRLGAPPAPAHLCRYPARERDGKVQLNVAAPEAVPQEAAASS